jgi:hypothetical protein
MDTKRLQQRVVGSGAAVDDKLKDISSAAETVARHMDWRLGNARMDEKLTLQEDDSELDEEGLLQIEELEGTLVVAGDLDLHQAAEFRKAAEKHIDTGDCRGQSSTGSQDHRNRPRSRA